MEYQDLRTLRIQVQAACEQVPNGLKIPLDLCKKLKDAWGDECPRFDASDIDLMSGPNGSRRPLPVPHRLIILAALAAELTEALYKYRNLYSGIFSELLIKKEVFEPLFATGASEHSVQSHPMWASIEAKIDALETDPASKANIKRFAWDNNWTGCSKGMGRLSDFYANPVCRAMGLNATNSSAAARASRDMVNDPKLAALKGDIIKVADGSYVPDPSDIKGSNKIYFGPPGTGKSFKARAEAKEGVFLRTLFHPEYTYSDFVGVYRPVVGSDAISGKITSCAGESIDKPVNYFDFIAGPLINALCQAIKTPNQNVFLVIEEINRGDCSAIFGDIFQLLDRNMDGVSEYSIEVKPEIYRFFENNGVDLSEGDGRLCFPANFSLIATMNTSDQSLYPMDSAFKRRWQWISCPIELSKAYDGKTILLKDPHESWDWAILLETINDFITADKMEDKQIGPWFIKPTSEGLIDFDEFLNKCLFYLWHDVFRDEHNSEKSPFAPNSKIKSFYSLQSFVRENGLQGAFKDEILEKAKVAKD
jgi:hypothetical protein